MELDWRHFDKQLAGVHAIMTCQAPLMSSVGSLVILPSATIGRGMHVHIDKQAACAQWHACLALMGRLCGQSVGIQVSWWCLYLVAIHDAHSGNSLG